MARRKKGSATYEIVAADSGYLSDLIETARQSDKAAGELMMTPSTTSSVDLILSKFSDTEWDIKATGAKLDQLNRKCHSLAKRVKYPKRFPIIPLESTLARIRPAPIARHERKALAVIDANVSAEKVAKARQPAAVDGYGRTRAAAKRLSTEEKGFGQADVPMRPDVQQAGRKRQRAQDGVSQLPGRKKIKTLS